MGWSASVFDVHVNGVAAPRTPDLGVERAGGAPACEVKLNRSKTTVGLPVQTPGLR